MSVASATTTTSGNQNVLTVTNSSNDVTEDHVIKDTTSDKKGITRQGAVAMDPTVTSRKGPPPVPTRASSTALTDEQRRQQQQQQQQQQSRDVTAVKVPPKVAKKPKANKRPTQPQASTGIVTSSSRLIT